MIDIIINRHRASLLEAKELFAQFDEKDWRFKPNVDRWSRIEIVGHLVDSAIHNYIRYNEVTFAPLPYAVRPYNQVELVKSNQYQHANIADLIELLFALNKRLLEKYEQFSEHTLGAEVITAEGIQTQLIFMVEGYVDHFQNHLKQIKNIVVV
ncbi:MAG TPA: DinB family protein [Saprospiraceae bacterium]|nr:DinB family protein [Saprospiraceae bacterium]HPN69665.1 DinB family protein [Saprospiraceae bacterium]